MSAARSTALAVFEEFQLRENKKSGARIHVPIQSLGAGFFMGFEGGFV
jgi:hypothetical protein